MSRRDADAARELVFDAWDATTVARRTKLARQALALDPDAIDAYVILALSANTPAEKIALLRQGVEIGRRLWAAGIRRPRQHAFWLDVETRPFMRALHDLALLLWDADQGEEAVALVEFLLRLNPDDNQGVRYLALAWHAALADWSAVERLLRRYREDGGTDYLYAAALDAFRRGADAGPLLGRAAQANPHVPALLLGLRAAPPEGESDYVAMGSLEEAASYVAMARAAWQAVPGAMDWLATAGPAAVADVADSDEEGSEGLSADSAELERLLDSCPDQDATMLLSELDGYLCGILVSPCHPAPAEWQPPIWGGDGAQPFPDDPVRSARLVELVHRRLAEIAGGLLQGHGSYSPIFGFDEDGEAIWEHWVEGFGRSMLVGEGWDPLFDKGDEDLETALAGLVRLLLLARGELEETLDEEAELAPALLPYYVETIYRRRHGLDRIALAGIPDGADFAPERPEPVRAGPRVGRNEPCPCGSGRKFKKCCGAAL